MSVSAKRRKIGRAWLGQRRGSGLSSVTMLCLLATGASAIGAMHANAAWADERVAPSYATQRLLEATGHATAAGTAPAVVRADQEPRAFVKAPTVPETRAQRLQRVLKEDGDTAARLVPLIMGFRNDLPDAVAYDIALAIAREARQHGLRAELVAAVIEVESNYNMQCVSQTNDHGLMQLHGERVYDIKQNVALGCLELATWRATYHCDERAMLAHYNGGCNPPGVSWSYADRVLRLAQGATPAP